MDTANIALFAWLAGLTALWSQIRGFLDRIRGLFIQRTTLNGNIAYSVSDYLYATTPIWRWGDSTIRSEPTWVRPRQRVMEVAYETAAVSPVVAWWKRRPVLFQSPSHPNGMSVLPEHTELITLLHLRGTLNVSHLIRDAIEWQSLKETTGRRYRVRHIGGKGQRDVSNQAGAPLTAQNAPVSDRMRPGTRYLHWSEDEIGSPRPENPFNAYALNAITAECRRDFQQWCQLKDWYLKRGIPWRRGHLLYGPPGTGKTALVRALAQEADFPVFAFDLSTLSNEDFRYAWNDMQESAPCIALIEDIDGVFQGRTNIIAQQEGMRSSLTFDCLLNALGGIQTADGVFVVITTNKPESLDEALGRPTAEGKSTRPGRLDRAFCIPPLDDQGRAAILARICDTATPEDIHATAGQTAAQVTEFAISKALAQTWNQEPGTMN